MGEASARASGSNTKKKDSGNPESFCRHDCLFFDRHKVRVAQELDAGIDLFLRQFVIIQVHDPELNFIPFKYA